MLRTARSQTLGAETSSRAASRDPDMLMVFTRDKGRSVLPAKKCCAFTVWVATEFDQIARLLGLLNLKLAFCPNNIPTAK